MIDIHTHLIPNVDDGAKNFDIAFRAFEEAVDVGFTDIVLTSHYISNSVETDSNKLVLEKEKLQKEIKDKNINLKLYTGMEIYISDDLPKLIDEKKVLTLADSKYILIELPINNKIYFLDYIIGSLREKSLKIILAHPERYLVVKENPDIVEEFIEKGCLIQCNLGSILFKRYTKPEY